MCQINTEKMKKQVGCVTVLVPPDIDQELSSGDITVTEGGNGQHHPHLHHSWTTPVNIILDMPPTFSSLSFVDLLLHGLEKTKRV